MHLGVSIGEALRAAGHGLLGRYYSPNLSQSPGQKKKKLLLREKHTIVIPFP